MPQEHGGALLRGGTIGPGRPPSKLRKSLRDVLDKGIPVIEGMVTGTVEATSADRLKAIDLAGRYGLGPPKVGYDEELIDELAALVGREINDFLEPQDAEELLDRIKAKWVPVLARKKMDG